MFKKLLLIGGVGILFFTSGCVVLKNDESSDQIEKPKTAEELLLEEQQAELRNDIDEWGTCEVDEDCRVVESKCPFGCYIGVNKDHEKELRESIDNYPDTCVYRCRLNKGVTCQENKCEISF